eukprot:751736-Hanusia_phi.AAC.2
MDARGSNDRVSVRTGKRKSTRSCPPTSTVGRPGPNCLTAGQQKLSPRSYKLIHKCFLATSFLPHPLITRHPPWHKKYPGEFENVLKPSNWVKVATTNILHPSDVPLSQVSGRSDYARQKAEVDSMFAPEVGSDQDGIENSRTETVARLDPTEKEKERSVFEMG